MMTSERRSKTLTAVLMITPFVITYLTVFAYPVYKMFAFELYQRAADRRRRVGRLRQLSEAAQTRNCSSHRCGTRVFRRCSPSYPTR